MKMTKQEKKLYCDIEIYKLKLSQRIYVGFKTIIDFLIALVGLIICIIPFIIIAIAIKCDSKGPVFFKHKRIGKNGKKFVFIKFRSMSIEAKPDIAGYEYSGVDSYITKVGAFLRKTSLDELPQFFSLLIGKMSLIGYRPAQESEIELNNARKEFDLYQIKPGITGWAQVNGRDILASRPTLKAKYDGYYLKHISLGLDIKIFFMTIIKVLKHSDIEEGKVKQGENREAIASS